MCSHYAYKLPIFEFSIASRYYGPWWATFLKNVVIHIVFCIRFFPLTVQFVVTNCEIPKLQKITLRNAQAGDSAKETAIVKQTIPFQNDNICINERSQQNNHAYSLYNLNV